MKKKKSHRPALTKLTKELSKVTHHANFNFETRQENDDEKSNNPVLH